MPILLALLLGFATAVQAAIPQGAKCPVCRMPVTTETRTAYSAERDREPTHFCSYSCAHAFHKKRPGSPLFARDYHTGAEIPAAEAWYLVKSARIAEEVEFGMAPVVVAFKDEMHARSLQARLKDGIVVRGIAAVDRTYEK